MENLWIFVALLAVHWFGDFALQTHWQASNKSKRWDALAQHVITYTTAIGLAAPILFPGPFLHEPWRLVLFVGGNGILHFATDYVTSRISSKLFMGQFETLELYPLNRVAMKQPFNPHNFFVMIGFDQLIHHITLAATMTWLLSNGR
jgi:hypothetical protein